MAVKSCKTPGIRYKEHATRKHGVQKDKYFYIRYTNSGKRTEEGLGWSTEGWTELKAAEILTTIKCNIKLGKHPQSFKEMREMNQKAAEEEKQEEIENEADRITLDEVFERYLPVHKAEVSENTCEVTERYYKTHIKKTLGHKKITDITIKDIQDLITSKMDDLAPATLGRIKAVLSQIFNFAKKYDLYFKENPLLKIKIKSVDNRRQRFLTKEEANELLEALKERSQDVYDMSLLSLYAGLRAGEIFKLRWEDVIWSSNRLAIIEPKNGENRMAPIHPLVKEMLERRYQFDKDGYVFKAKNGGKIIYGVSDTFQRTVDQIGLNKKNTDARQNVVFHTLRHTYASWLVMAGVDLYTV